jgi:hypothetical protein
VASANSHRTTHMDKGPSDIGCTKDNRLIGGVIRLWDATTKIRSITSNISGRIPTIANCHLNGVRLTEFADLDRSRPRTSLGLSSCMAMRNTRVNWRASRSWPINALSERYEGKVQNLAGIRQGSLAPRRVEPSFFLVGDCNAT